MSMSRKDYVILAAALKAARVPNTLGKENKALYNNGVDNAVAFIVQALAKDNPRFDGERFRAAASAAGFAS
jgi:hypothetical protein